MIQNKNDFIDGFIMKVKHLEATSVFPEAGISPYIDNVILQLKERVGVPNAFHKEYQFISQIC